MERSTLLIQKFPCKKKCNGDEDLNQRSCFATARYVVHVIQKWKGSRELRTRSDQKINHDLFPRRGYAIVVRKEFRHRKTRSHKPETRAPETKVVKLLRSAIKY